MAGKRKKAAKRAQDSRPEQRKRLPGKPFKRGQSGNPGGQPKWVKGVRDLLQETAPLAAEYLRKVIQGEPFIMQVDGESVEVPAEHQHRVAAARTVLEYTTPKPTAKVEMQANVAAVQLSQLSREELLAIAALPDGDDE